MIRTIIGWTCFIVLTLIAFLHVYWGFGGLWPATNQADLIATVIGSPNLTQMPSLLTTGIVAVLVFTAGGFALARGVLGLNSFLLVRIPIMVLALIFLGRGLITYLPNGPLSAAIEPFASLNNAYFSPLIIALGVGFAFLAKEKDQ